MSGRNLLGVLTTYQGDLIACAVLLAIAISIGVYNVSGSGQLWPDASQYANAGAMIHDWLLSGEILHPYQFAKKNYAQYPAFHLPYHPPVYPGLLGVFFVAAGTSYFSARLFVALCLGVSGCSFYGILRVMEARRAGAFACATLLLTLPELAFWARDTMSEIPALALILAGSFFFPPLAPKGPSLLLFIGSWDRGNGLPFTRADSGHLARLAPLGFLSRARA